MGKKTEPISVRLDKETADALNALMKQREKMLKVSGRKASYTAMLNETLEAGLTLQMVRYSSDLPKAMERFNNSPDLRLFAVAATSGATNPKK